MKRRTVLRACGVGVAAGLAGCGSTPADPAAEGTDTDEPTETDTDEPETTTDESTGESDGDATPGPDDSSTPAMDSSALSADEGNCGGGMDPSTTVTFDDGALEVVVDGTITAPNPCHRPVLADASYDAETDTLEITVGIEAPDPEKMCVECVGALEYTASVGFSGALPGSVTVVHDGIERTTVTEETNDA